MKLFLAILLALLPLKIWAANADVLIVAGAGSGGTSSTSSGGGGGGGVNPQKFTADFKRSELGR